MDYRVTNQTTQPVELSNGRMLAVNETETMEKITRRERNLAAANIIFIQEVPEEKTPVVAGATSSKTRQSKSNADAAPDSGQ